MQYPIPNHCELAVVFQRAIMLVFQPITVPFYYRVYKNDADDFFDKHCLDCSLRLRSCQKTGAIQSSCPLRNYVISEEQTACIQMPLPKHILVFGIYNESPKFCYEDPDCDCLRGLLLGNIGDTGWWCNGDVNYANKNPSSIYNAYFNSLHNSDLTGKGDQYERYLQEVSQDFSKIIRSYRIDPEDWGAVVAVTDNPTQIEWSHQQEDESYNYLRTYGYARIS